MISTVINLKRLYEDDYLLWLETNIQLLNERQLDGLDYDNLVEELTDLGRSERRVAENLLKQLLIHLLLYQYWLTERERNANHWKGEIINFREQLKREFRAKTIYNYAVSEFAEIYEVEAKVAEAKSGVAIPSQCPYLFEQVISGNWLP